jgi:hypothetical protein
MTASMVVHVVTNRTPGSGVTTLSAGNSVTAEAGFVPGGGTVPIKLSLTKDGQLTVAGTGASVVGITGADLSLAVSGGTAHRLSATSSGSVSVEAAGLGAEAVKVAATSPSGGVTVTAAGTNGVVDAVATGASGKVSARATGNNGEAGLDTTLYSTLFCSGQNTVRLMTASMMVHVTNVTPGSGSANTLVKTRFN